LAQETAKGSCYLTLRFEYQHEGRRKAAFSFSLVAERLPFIIEFHTVRKRLREGAMIIKLSLGFICAVFIVLPAMGADRYQILPIAQTGSPKAGIEHNAALVIDTQGDGVFACVADLRSKSGDASVVVSCLREKVDKGTVPPGPAAIPPAIIPWNDEASFWKMDPTSGDVTFCGTFEQVKLPQHIVCGAASLPK
jgi:hypothetical protein